MSVTGSEKSREFVLLESGLSTELMGTGIGESKVERLRSGLVKIGVIDESESLLGLTDRSPWHRGGGETFVSDSVVFVGTGSQEHGEEVPGGKRHVIAKALVSFGSPPEIMMASWLKRRGILVSLEIPVPRLFGAVEGTLYEEFIDDELSPESLLIPEIVAELGRIAAVLDRAGFATLSFMADVRRRETKLYYVDFGFDLGEPSDVPSSNARTQLELKLAPVSRDLAMHSYNLHFGAGT